jgi:hypothetical protein
MAGRLEALLNYSWRQIMESYGDAQKAYALNPDYSYTAQAAAEQVAKLDDDALNALVERLAKELYAGTLEAKQATLNAAKDEQRERRAAVNVAEVINA